MISERLKGLAFEDGDVSLECVHGSYHEMGLTRPTAAVLCNPGLEVHFASWAPTVRLLIQQEVPTVSVGHCAFQDLACFDAAIMEPVLRWLGARVVLPSCCSPFPLLRMDMRLIALKGPETVGVPFWASDGVFCVFRGEDASFCSEGRAPDTPAELLRCFLEYVCRLEMLRDELLDPADSAASVPQVVEAVEPPHKKSIREFFGRHNLEPIADVLPASSSLWQDLFVRLGFWPLEPADDGGWSVLYAKFWSRRADLGERHLLQEALQLRRLAEEAGEVIDAELVCRLPTSRESAAELVD